MTHSRVALVLRLAGRNHGVLRTDMLAEAGIDRSALSRLTASGVLEPFIARGIRRVAGSAPTPHQRLLASVWAAGPHAVASHRSAGWLWRLDPIGRLLVEVSVPPGSTRRPPGILLHHASDVATGLVTTVDGIPVTDPTLTLVDLAAVLSAEDLECAFDSALRQGLTSVGRATAILDRLGRRGRNGIGGFRALLEARNNIDGVTESVFETRLVQVLRKAGLPEPVRQVKLFDDDGFIGRFDCTYPPARVAIEADSVKHHHARDRFEADRERRARAEAIGWRVPTFTWRQLTRRPKWVASITMDTLDQSGWDWRLAA